MSQKNETNAAPPIDDETILAQLETAALKAGIGVRYENLADDDVTIGSGLCHLRHRPLLIIDTRLSTRKKWAIVARELRSIDTDAMFLPPLVRRLIEQADS